MNSKKNILITGCTGYIGNLLIHRLVNTNSFNHIHGLSRSGYSFKSSIFTHHKIDLNSPELLNLINHIKPSVVIHLASQRFGTLSELFNNNVLATQNLLNAIKFNQLENNCRVIIIGSSAEIGIPQSNQPINEHAECTPIDNYGLTKLMQSMISLKESLTANLDVVRLRFFNVIGPNLPVSLLPGKAFHEFHFQMTNPDHQIEFGDLSSFRDYTDIQDLLDAIELAIIHGKKSHLYHIGSGRSYSGLQLINEILALAPKALTSFSYKHNSAIGSLVPYQVADINKAMVELGWVSKFSLTDSIKKIWGNK